MKKVLPVVLCAVFVLGLIVLWGRLKPAEPIDYYSSEAIADRFFERIMYSALEREEVISFSIYTCDDQRYINYRYYYPYLEMEVNLAYQVNAAGDFDRWINLNWDDLADMEYLKDAYEYAVEHGECKTFTDAELEKYYEKYPLLTKAGASDK